MPDEVRGDEIGEVAHCGERAVDFVSPSISISRFPREHLRPH
jgi:hypothetical protein